MPYPASSARSLSSTITCSGDARIVAEIIPPSTIPPTKKRFHDSFRQSYLKNEKPDGATAAQRCLKEEEIPKDLFPISNRSGTVRPIKGPEIYQGHGLDNRSIMRNYLNGPYHKYQERGEGS